MSYTDRWRQWCQALGVSGQGFYAEHWLPPERDPEFERAFARNRRLPKHVANWVREQEPERLRSPEGRVSIAKEVAADQVHSIRSGFLRDLVQTSGGVCVAADALVAAISRLQEAADFNRSLWPPNVEVGFSHDASVNISVEFSNLLIWARTLEERLERAIRGRWEERTGILPEAALWLRDRLANLAADYGDRD